jgi:hypothetical protein
VTNDSIFNIFEKGLPPMRAAVDVTAMAAAASGGLLANTNVSTEILLSNADDYKFFNDTHVIINERTQEVMWVTATASGTITVDTRGSHATPDDKAAFAAGDYILAIGTRNPEGGGVPDAISHDATMYTNYTQIFRTAMHLTGSAKETYLRTGDISTELKRMIAERHAIEMEWAWIFGKKNQTAVSSGGTGLYERTTGGFVERCGSTNVTDFNEVVTKAGWESFLEDIFLVPNSKDEKLCLCGNRALTTLNAMAAAYGQIGLVPTGDAFGLKLSRWETPYGTLYLKGHPLLSQNSNFNDWGLVVDPSNMVYRPLKNRDTKFLKDRQAPGLDAVIHEFFTDAGLEIRHAATHGLFKNAAAFQP